MGKKIVSTIVVLCMLANLCGCASSPAPAISTTTSEVAADSTTGALAAELAESVKNTQPNQDERGDLGFDEETDTTDASAGASEEGGSPYVAPPVVDPEPEVEPEPEPEVIAPEHGQHAYTVGDTTVYTEHPIERWMTPDSQVDGVYDLDLCRMLEDLWCEGGGNVVDFSTKVPRVDFIKDGEAMGGAFFEVPDPGFQYCYHSVTLTRTFGDKLYSASITMYDWEIDDDDPFILTNYYRTIPIELAVLLLLAAERMEKESENFALDDINPGPNFQID